MIKLSHLAVSMLDEDTVSTDNLGESRDKIWSKHNQPRSYVVSVLSLEVSVD